MGIGKTAGTIGGGIVGTGLIAGGLHAISSTAFQFGFSGLAASLTATGSSVIGGTGILSSLAGIGTAVVGFLGTTLGLGAMVMTPLLIGAAVAAVFIGRAIGSKAEEQLEQNNTIQSANRQIQQNMGQSPGQAQQNSVAPSQPTHDFSYLGNAHPGSNQQGSMVDRYAGNRGPQTGRQY